MAEEEAAARSQRAEKIAGILAERARSAGLAEGIKAELAAISTAVDELDRIRLDLLPRVADDAANRLASWAVPLHEIAEQVRLEQAAVDRTLARLRRPTLNIGMVGRARQGKSRFLQSLTGLTTREIPDGRDGFCTGVPSLIQHVPAGETYADVYFHSPVSFVSEVLGPYYQQLGLGPVPSTPAGFGSRPLAKLAPTSDTEQESRYQHLRAYHAEFGGYEELIGATSPRRVKAGEIRSYVAQDDESGLQKYQRFRAVRRVNIATKFHHADLGGIGVIDLPGLGDTNLGDSRVMLSALKDDVDIVLFLRRPNPEGDAIHDNDTALYNMAKGSFPEIPMERRSFLVLNHRRSVDVDNYARCTAFRDLVAGSTIRVASTMIADCSSPQEVRTAFDPVVDYLLANIGALDRMLLDERTRRLGEIRQEIRMFIRDAAGLGVLAQPESEWFALFLDLFDSAHTDLSVEIENLVVEYAAERNSPDSLLEVAVREALARAGDDDGIPTTDAIRRSFAAHGGPRLAYLHMLDETRSYLSRHFLGLDAALRETVKQMLGRVADMLRDAGHLAPLGDEEGREFLRLLAGRVDPAAMGGGSGQVKYAVEMLLDFDLSYRSFIQHRVRPCLDKMYSEKPMIEYPTSGPALDEHQVREMLETTYKETLFDCETALLKLLSEPNQAVFAIVEEFRDRVLRARDVKREWEAIYQDLKTEIWADQFAVLSEKSVHLRTWNEAVKRLEATANGEGN